MSSTKPCTGGSSPLARGTHQHHPPRAALQRIIPARAGNTAWCGGWGRGRADHPRSRGEHGTPAGPGVPDRRIIPARAGNTCCAPMPACRTADHPRSRGEHPMLRSLRLGSRGSSPLARGTRSNGDRGELGNRIIPARAGNTIRLAPSPSIRSDHPRSRGEHEAVGLDLSGGRRIIPARAGNTRSGCCAAGVQPDHPRSRGEHQCWQW